MSDSNIEDPVLQHLRERKRELEDRITDARARLGEVDGLIASLGDGRTRIRRRLKEAPAPADGPQMKHAYQYQAVTEPPEAA